MNKQMVLGSMAMTLSWCFAGEVQWVPGATSLDEGRILVEYEEEDVSRMTVSPASGDPITLTSDSAIAFAADAAVRVANGGSFRMDAGIAGAGDLSFGLKSPMIAYANRTDYLPGSEAEAVVLASGVNLADYEITRTEYNFYLSTAYNWIGKTTASAPLFVERGEGGVSGDSGAYSYHISCQVQGKDDYARCVMLEIRQRGDEIIAWTPTCYHGATSRYGEDFRTLSEDAGECWSHPISCVATKTGGYGLSNLELTAINGEIGSIVLSKSVALGGTLSVARALTVEAEGSTALTDAQEWGVALSVDGTFRIRNHAFLRLTGNVSYGSEGRIDLVADASHAEPMPDHLDLGDYPGEEWTKVATGVHILSVTNITAKGAGSWLSCSDAMPIYFFFCNTGTNLTCQFQIANGPYVKGIVYELRQVGDDIEARIPYVGYKDYGTGEKAYQEQGLHDIQKGHTKSDVRTGPDVAGYGLMDVKLWLDGSRWRGIELGGTVIKDGGMHVYGSSDERIFVRALSADALPSVTVHEGGKFCTQADNPSIDRALVVEEGGEFDQIGAWTISQHAQPVLRGGTMVIGYDLAGKVPATEIASVYLSRVTFADGGTLTGLIPRSGYYYEPVWKVSGSHPAALESGIALTSKSTTGTAETCTFDVENVTGDAEADLTIGGRICYGNWNNIGMLKTGAGTVLATAKNEAALHPLNIEGGLWKLGTTGCMTTDHAVELSGGSLGSAVGVSNAVGQVSLAADTICGIDLEAGSELDLSSLSFGANARLNVTTDESATARLRVLTPCGESDLRCIRVNGKRAAQDADGYVTAGNFGLILMVR